MTYNSFIRTYNATMGRDSTPDPSASLKSWQRYAVTVRNALCNCQTMRDIEAKKIADTYAPKVVAEKLADLDEQFTEVRKIAEDAVKTRLDAVIKGKKDRLRKATTAPTEADLRLLQTLSMRSVITESDIIHAAEAIGPNLVALGTLADIATSHGINLPIPSVDRMEEALDHAAVFGSDMIKMLGSDDGSLTYSGNCFFLHPDIEDGPVAAAFADLDENLYTAEQVRAKIESAKIETKGFVEGADASEVELREGNHLGNILMQFGVRRAAVEQANPALDLDDLHPGDRIIIPSTKMKLTNGAGFVGPDQVSPARLADSKLSEDTHRSIGQTRTALTAAGQPDGTTITIPAN